MKESGSSTHSGSYHTGQTVQSWSPLEMVQGTWRDSEEGKT